MTTITLKSHWSDWCLCKCGKSNWALPLISIDTKVLHKSQPNADCTACYLMNISLSNTHFWCKGARCKTKKWEKLADQYHTKVQVQKVLSVLVRHLDALLYQKVDKQWSTKKKRHPITSSGWGAGLPSSTTMQSSSSLPAAAGAAPTALSSPQCLLGSGSSST